MADSKFTILLYLILLCCAECQIHHPGCVFLKKACVDFSCYKKCTGILSRDVERDLLKVCGNTTFFDCFIKQHITEKGICGKRYRRCLEKPDNDETSPNLKVAILLTAIISSILLVIAVVCYCRIYMRSRLQNQKKFYSIELPGNDLSLSSEMVRVSWIVEHPVNENAEEAKTESIWNNIYIRKLQDYETSEEEGSTCDDDETGENAKCKEKN